MINLFYYEDQWLISNGRRKMVVTISGQIKNLLDKCLMKMQ